MKNDRATHLALVEQATKMHRQPWPLPEPKTFPACCGACDQGRGICFSPEACQLPELPLPLQTWRPVFLFLAAFWASVALLIKACS
jgi:hypothetical protein